MKKISRNIKESESAFTQQKSVVTKPKNGKSLAELGGKTGNINDLGLNSGSLPVPSDAPDTPSVEDGSRDNNKAKIGKLGGAGSSGKSAPNKFSKPENREAPKSAETSDDEVVEESMTFAEMLEAMDGCKSWNTAPHKIQKEDENMEDDFEDGSVDGADGAITGDETGDAGAGAEGEGVSVTKEFLLKLLSATMGKTFDETQLDLIVDTIASAGAGATLDVSDIPTIMDQLKAAAGEETGAGDEVGGDEALGGDMGGDDTDIASVGGIEGDEGAGDEGAGDEDEDDGFGGGKKTKLIDSEDKEQLEEGVLGVFAIKPVLRNMNDWNNQETDASDNEEEAMIRAMKKRAGLKYWK